MKQLNQIGKTRAIAWYQKDVSQAEIARRLDVSKSTDSKEDPKMIKLYLRKAGFRPTYECPEINFVGY